MKRWQVKGADAVIIGPLFAAWAYIVVRAQTVAFVHDESITYGILHGEADFVKSANNHWLNTLAMRVSQAVFGESEFALRLPNVLAFGVYAAAIAAILWPLKMNARVIGVVLLIGNPFALEFFSLARGYGLGLAFTAASIAALVRHRIPLAVAAGVLAFYASFGALNVTLAVFAVALLVRRPAPLVTDSAELPRTRLMGRFEVARVASVAIGFIAMVPGMIHVKRLQDAGGLYVGGDRGFIADTIGSVVKLSSGWGQGLFGVVGEVGPNWLPFPEGAVVVVAILCIVYALKVRRWDAAGWVCTVFVIAVVAQHVESALFGSLWPQDRAALTYLVPFAFMVALAVDHLPALKLAPLVGGISIALILNFAAQANLSHTSLWKYDQSSRAVMRAVKDFEASHGIPAKPWKLLAGFPRERALDYYRQIWGMTWVLPLTGEPVTPDGDLFYVDADDPPIPDTVVIAHFAGTNTDLRVRRELVSD